MVNTSFGQRCTECGGEYSLWDYRVLHKPECSIGALAAATEHAAPPAPPAPSNVASFSQARAMRSYPREHGPMEALALAREWIEQHGPADHVIVFIGKTNSDNSSGTKYFQTGSFSAHAQAGLIVEGMDMLRNSGRD